MQSQRCVLCTVHGQPDKGFLVQSRKLENVPWITWKAGSAQRARCAKNQAHFTPCASHWQNIAVEWICSFTLNLGSIMLLLLVIIAQWLGTIGTFMYVQMMQRYPHVSAVLGPSSLLHPSSRMQFHVHPHVTRTAEWENVESYGKFLKQQPPQMHVYHGYCYKKCAFVGVLWFGDTNAHCTYIVIFHHLPDSHLQSLQKVSSITMVTVF